MTPLQLAVRRGYVKVVELLISHLPSGDLETVKTGLVAEVAHQARSHQWSLDVQRWPCLCPRMLPRGAGLCIVVLFSAPSLWLSTHTHTHTQGLFVVRIVLAACSFLAALVLSFLLRSSPGGLRFPLCDS